MNGNVWLARTRAVSALGATLEELWEGLLEGRSGIAPVVRFPTRGYVTALAAEVPGLAVAGNASRLEALLDLLLADFGPVPEGTWLVTASTKGKIDALEHLRQGRPYRAEDLWLRAVPAAVAERLVGISPQGSVNVNAACASSTIALAQAATRIAAGQVPAALVVAVDMVSEFVFSGFSALKALSPGGARPFDRARDGLTLGEGACALLLVGDALASDLEPGPRVRFSGWGVANDAFHITAPDRTGRGLHQAMAAALAKAGRSPQEVGAVCAHGTGTLYNDAMELTAFRTLFGPRVPPAFSVKGTLGHTLGAAGALEAAVSAQSLLAGRVPPTVRLQEPDPQAEGIVSNAAVAIAGNHLLTTNSGFGGVNAALVLSLESPSSDKSDRSDSSDYPDAHPTQQAAP